MKTLLSEDICKNFGNLKALEHVNLSIELGERRALIGPNGSGKTTLFHIISGLLRPTSGTVFISGKNVTKPHIPAFKRAALGLSRTFQLTSLFFPLTVQENLLLALKAVYDHNKRGWLTPFLSYRNLYSEVDGLLKQWGLWDKRDSAASSLSYGEQRRLELAMALAQKPKILLLDEPTSGLPMEEVAGVVSMINALPSNLTLLVIEHDMDVAFALAERLTVLNCGRVLATGTKEEIRKIPDVQRIYFGAAEI